MCLQWGAVQTAEHVIASVLSTVRQLIAVLSPHSPECSSLPYCCPHLCTQGQGFTQLSCDLNIVKTNFSFLVWEWFIFSPDQTSNAIQCVASQTQAAAQTIERQQCREELALPRPAAGLLFPASDTTTSKLCSISRLCYV